MNEASQSVRKIVTLGLFLAMAIVLNIIESSMPFPYGVRLGLANVVAMAVMGLYGWKDMLGINGLRVLLSGLMRGTFLSYPFFMSLCGVALSSLVLLVFWRRDLTMPFKGVLCALAHACGQIFVLGLFVKSAAFAAYLPVMAVSAVITGMFTGRVSDLIIQRVRGQIR